MGYGEDVPARNTFADSDDSPTNTALMGEYVGDMSGTERAYQRINIAIERADQGLLELLERLRSVLLETSPSPRGTEMKEPSVAADCNLAQALQHQARRLEELVDVIQDASARVDV